MVIDKRIDAAEEQAADSLRESLRDRWEFGRLMLAERKGKQLPKGAMAKLVEATGKSETELKYRARFAERYPTEDEVGRAMPTFTSWTQVKKSLPKPTEKPPKPKPPPKPAPKRDDARLADAIYDRESEGASYTATDIVDDVAARGLDISIETAQRAMREERIARCAMDEATPIDWSSLPMTAAKKIDAARRQIRRELEAEIEPRVQAEVQRRIGKAFDRIEEQYDKIERFESAQRNGIFTKADYNLIKSCLHPDSRASVSDEKLANAFRVFNEANVKLVPPPKPNDLPSLDELRRQRAERQQGAPRRR